MTTATRVTYEQRVRATLLGDTARIPVILGLCGTGRTTVLHRLGESLGPTACQYVNVERTATTPERFLRAVTAASPFPESREVRPASSPREAFDATLGFLASARCADGSPATFLLDEMMEFRTFESFPGLRHALPEVLAVLASTPNRFVLASRYVTRSERALAGASPHYLLAPIHGLGADEVDRMIDAPLPNGGAAGIDNPPTRPGAAGLAVHRLTGGRPAYARALVESIHETEGRSPHDVVAALRRSLGVEGRLSRLCAHCYELRLHRARGYGALKAILDILSEEEPLTLTEISLRLGRTAGSTKDYLSWLDDVDLVSVSLKRYRFRDPLMRVWCRLHCRPVEPTEGDVAREAEAYAASRLAAADASPARSTEI